MLFFRGIGRPWWECAEGIVEKEIKKDSEVDGHLEEAFVPGRGLMPLVVVVAGSFIRLARSVETSAISNRVRRSASIGDVDGSVLHRIDRPTSSRLHLKPIA